MMPINSSSMYNTHSLTNVNTEASTPIGVVKSEALLNRTFVLTKVNGAVPDTIAGNSATVKFDENFQLHAKIDNALTGRVTYENGMLKSNELTASVLKGSNTEITFIDVLAEGAKVSMDGNKLVLQSNGNELVFE